MFAPMGINCYAGDLPPSALRNVAMGYAHNNQRGIYAVPRNSIKQTGLMSSAAGGMVCNVNGMIKWLQALLSKTNLPFSENQLQQMWQAHTILPVSENEAKWDETLFKNYGLGWRLANVGKLKIISHTGTISGYQAYVAIVPNLELGVVLLNNGSNFAARSAVMQTIIKAFINNAGYMQNIGPTSPTNWVNTYIDYLDEREQAYLSKYEVPSSRAPVSINAQDIVGEYTDKWFGSFIIALKLPPNKNASLRITHSKMKTLVGTLTPFQDTSYKVVWDNANAQGPAFVHFQLNTKREVVSATMHPFSVKRAHKSCI